MGRKKKVETEDRDVIDNKFVYCSLNKCPHRECIRHYSRSPWNEIITVRKYAPDKEWNCKDMKVED